MPPGARSGASTGSTVNRWRHDRTGPPRSSGIAWRLLRLHAPAIPSALTLPMNGLTVPGGMNARDRFTYPTVSAMACAMSVPGWKYSFIRLTPCVFFDST